MIQIKNYQKLIKNSSMRRHALDISLAGLEACDIRGVFKNEVRLENNTLAIKGQEFDLARFKNIYVIGGGKASGEMAKEVKKILGKRVKRGIVNSVKKINLGKIKVVKAGHPVPTQTGVTSTKKIIGLVKNVAKDDLVICLISGGGSSLLTYAKYPLKKMIKIYNHLLKSGATISEINIVRKHISNIKGGFLAQWIYPATCITIIISDVPGDDLSVIASGPTYLDRTTKKEAEKIIEKYNLPKLRFLETPKERKYFKKVYNLLILTNKTALEAMKKKAKELGYRTRIYSTKLQGEAKKIGQRLVKKCKKDEVLLCGGETTVRVTGKGKGGRNQELVLGVLKHLLKNCVIVSIGSDGQDNTNAAGAIADLQTVKMAQRLNLDIDKYLKDNNSYNFFKGTKDLIFTGSTGTNVADLIAVIKK